MTKRINHSQRIISELRNSLDHSIGGDISRNLEALYDFMFHEHLEMLVDQNPGRAENCIRVITPLLDAWRSIPMGTGEQAARDHARGLLKDPGYSQPPEGTVGPETANQEQSPVADRNTADDASLAASGPKKSELVSVSA